MNKLTTVLAGVALAAALAAPASANNGIFQSTTSTLPPFAFGAGNASYTLTAAPVVYFTTTTAPVFGTLSLTGSGLVAGSTYTYANTLLSFTPTSGPVYTETGGTTVTLFQGNTAFAGAQKLSKGDLLNLTYSPVPEASTVVSFGALLALGGLAVLRRKSVARAS